MRKFLLGCTSATLAGATLSAFAFVGMPFELLSHFRPSFALLALTIAVLVAIKDWRLSLPAVAAAALFSIQISGTSWRAIEPAADGPVLSVAWANLFGSRAAAEGFAEFVRISQPDVIAMAEAGDLTDTDLTALFPSYRHVLKSEKQPYPTVIILSVHPLKDERIHDRADPARPWASATVSTPERDWRFAAAHAMAPLSSSMMFDRNLVIRDVGWWIEDGGDVVVGDFNATPWSPVLKNSGLERAGNPFLAPTWGRRTPLLGLPIDHVFVTSSVEVRELRVWPAIGSDHFPVYAELVWKGE